MKIPAIAALFLTLVVIFPAKAEEIETSPRAELPPVLVKLVNDINASLHQLDNDLTTIAASIAAGEAPTMPTAWPYVAGVYFARGEEGTFGFTALLDRIDAPLTPLHRAERPLLRRFTMRDGVPIFALQHPVYGDADQPIGAVAFLFPSDEFLARVIEPQVEGFPVDAWAMLPTGQHIYDPDTQEVGLNLLTDPLYAPYADLRALGERIAMTGAGDGIYRFLATGFDEEVTKRAHWATAGIHNMQWRIVLVQVIEGNPLLARRSFSDMEAMYLRNRLREVAESEPMTRAIAQGNAESVHGLLHAFVAENPAVYSVQWVDKAGVIRFGWPEANSMQNYNLADGTIEGDKDFLHQLNAGNEHWQVRTLAEGGEALMFLAPLPDGGGLLLIRRIEVNEEEA